MSWSRVYKSQPEGILTFEYEIPEHTSEEDVKPYFIELWELFIKDVLPEARVQEWHTIWTYFRPEDGGGGIGFQKKDGDYIDGIPVVDVRHWNLVSHLTQEGHDHDELLKSWWENGRMEYANILIQASVEAGLPAAVDDEHKPFGLAVMCYEDVIIEKTIF